MLSDINNSLCYNLCEKVSLKKYYIFILFVAFLFLILLVIPFDEYKKYYLYIENDNYKLIVDEEFFPIKKDSFYIENIKYKYEVLSISDGSLVNNKKYYEVMIQANLKEDILTTKNIIEVIIKKRKRSLIEKFIDEIK